MPPTAKFIVKLTKASLNKFLSLINRAIEADTTQELNAPWKVTWERWFHAGILKSKNKEDLMGSYLDTVSVSSSKNSMQIQVQGNLKEAIEKVHETPKDNMSDLTSGVSNSNVLNVPSILSTSEMQDIEQAIISLDENLSNITSE